MESPEQVCQIPNLSFETDVKPFVIVGGLGGCGLELARWLALKGAKKIYLAVRLGSGIKTGIQQKSVDEIRDLMQSNYGEKQFEKGEVALEICNQDFTDYEEVKKFLNTHDGIFGFFNLAAVLQDKVFDNQDQESWDQSITPKVKVTANFHRAFGEVTTLPKPKYFVTFSSVSAGLGNCGQTNYAYQNSYMDQICKEREMQREKELQNQEAAGTSFSSGISLSIQWGPIAGVGLLTKETTGAGGILNDMIPMNIDQCLGHLEELLSSGATGVHTVYLKKPQQPIGELKEDTENYSLMMLELDNMNKQQTQTVEEVWIMFLKKFLSISTVSVCNDINELSLSKSFDQLGVKSFDELGVDSLNIDRVSNLVSSDLGLEPKNLSGITLQELKDEFLAIKHEVQPATENEKV